MRPSRDELAKALADLPPSEIEAIRRQALVERERERVRQALAKSPDPLGTIRYNDTGSAHPEILWVRSSGGTWEPFIHDNHGVGAADHELPWRDHPVVGAMPEAWVAKERRYDEEDYG